MAPCQASVNLALRDLQERFLVDPEPYPAAVALVRYLAEILQVFLGALATRQACPIASKSWFLVRIKT